MNENLEIELRGPLKYREDRIILKLKNNSKINRGRQLVVFIKDLPFDFRIKCNESLPYVEFIQKNKLDNLRGVHHEISFKIQKTDLKNFIEILSLFCIKKGFYSLSDRLDLFTSDIIWSIKKGSVIGDYWEAEASHKLLAKLKKRKKVIKYLSKFASELGLKIWSEKEFKKHKDLSWKKIKAKPLSLLWKKNLN